MKEAEYIEHLSRIARQNPAEPLLPALRAGYSRANVLYIKAALRRMPTAGSDMEAEPRWQDRTPHADETLRSLWRERTRLFGLMNKQSNAFHNCRTDADRADNSRRVLSWWDDILAVKAKIAYYEQHGALPAEPEEADELPDNPVQLSKRLNSLRARISQKKAQLRDLAGLDEGTPGKQSKIDAAERDLKALKHQAGMAEVKLRVYGQE